MVRQAGIAALLLFGAAFSRAQTLPIVADVEPQPFIAQVRRLIEAADHVGSPFSAAEKKRLEEAMRPGDAAGEEIQAVLDGRCLFGVTINPESRVKVVRGPARPELLEQGWRMFLVKVENQAGSTAPLVAVSPNAISLFTSRAANTPSDKEYCPPGDTSPRPPRDLWVDLQMFDTQPLQPTLSGLKLEYRIVHLFSRDAGRREAKFAFNIGQGTQDIGFRNEVDVLFDCRPAHEVVFRVRDESGQPTTAAFLIRDRAGLIYPSQAKRLAPDFAFHAQIYRSDGETLRLPAGAYRIEFRRGPESILQNREIAVVSDRQSFDFEIKRWIDPARLGWWSGDQHIHASGCSHYNNPTEGVHAPDMMRHCLGEDLKIGSVLTWGPGFDYQKQFFSGEDDKVSRHPYLLRYNLEVSGFGSHQSGHLVLLRLKNPIYPGGDSTAHWPTLGLNTLRWAKAQGAVSGTAHSGGGLDVQSNAVPNYLVPPFNGIGANEFIVNITHDVPGPEGRPVPAVDLLATVNTSPVTELNLWYHVLNCGFRPRLSGETDFPCVTDERVGVGRSYVKIDGRLEFGEWCDRLRDGRSYVSDGRSHLLEFKASRNGSPVVAVGEQGSELRLDRPSAVRVTAKVAAWLDEEPVPDANVRRDRFRWHLDGARVNGRLRWHLEGARVGTSREVPVEVVVNGSPVAKTIIRADGTMQDVAFDVNIQRSSWVALRIFPSSHTNPIFILVDGRPIHASQRSAEWCLKGVDQCWTQKARFYKADEMEEAKQAYEHARQTYRRIMAESDGN